MMRRTSSTEPVRFKMPLSEKELRSLLGALAAGALFVYPTETFYALGCVAWCRESVLSVLALKERSEGEGLPLIAESIEVLRRQVHHPPLLRTMADAFWPGPLTIVMKLKQGSGADEAAARDGTIAVRVPGSREARRLAGSGLLVATSANRRGAEAPVSPEEIDPILLERVQILVDGGKTPGGLPSTILDLSRPRPRILREGKVSRAAINAANKKASD